jgi:hypothetical protein
VIDMIASIYQSVLLRQGRQVKLKALGDVSQIAIVIVPVQWWGLDEEKHVYRIAYGRDEKIMLVERKDIVCV